MPGLRTPPAAAAPAKEVGNPDNDVCLGCHGNEGFAMPGADGKMRDLHIIKDKFGNSVHGKRLCTDCHKDITEIPHKLGVTHKVSCVTCHEALWAKAQQEGKAETPEYARLGVVIQMINRYMNSIHARPSRDDQSRTNATCYNCHDPHYVYPTGTPEYDARRLNIPNICGKCHTKERAQYATSVHGKLVLEDKVPAAPVCSRLPHHRTTSKTRRRLQPSSRSPRTAATAIRKNLKTYTRHLSRSGREAGLRLYRQVLRLPRQPHHPARWTIRTRWSIRPTA